MKKLPYGLMMLLLLLLPVTYAGAQVSVGIGIGLPNLSIGINLPLFPELTPVPGYPVYYAPQVHANYFFYDGMYWVYQDDNWYASTWYNGPWGFVEPEFVPSFVLRIPVRYYRQPPMYFRGWQANAPPRWGQHWGNGWQERRDGWDRWNRNSAPTRAPRPTYQSKYAGDRYPQVEQQRAVRGQNYRYKSRDTAVRQHIRQQDTLKQTAPAQRGRQGEPAVRNQGMQDAPRATPLQRGAPADPRTQPPQRGGEFAQKPAPDHAAPQQRGSERQQAPRAEGHEQRQQERGASPESNRGNGQGRDKDDERGRGRDK